VYDRASGAFIPEGFVQVYGFWGPLDGYEVLVAEPVYLDLLAAALSAAGHPAEAARVRSLAERPRQGEPKAAPDRSGM